MADPTNNYDRTTENGGSNDDEADRDSDCSRSNGEQRQQEPTLWNGSGNSLYPNNYGAAQENQFPLPANNSRMHYHHETSNGLQGLFQTSEQAAPANQTLQAQPTNNTAAVPLASPSPETDLAQQIQAFANQLGTQGIAAVAAAGTQTAPTTLNHNNPWQPSPALPQQEQQQPQQQTHHSILHHQASDDLMEQLRAVLQASVARNQSSVAGLTNMPTPSFQSYPAAPPSANNHPLGVHPTSADFAQIQLLLVLLLLSPNGLFLFTPLFLAAMQHVIMPPPSPNPPPRNTNQLQGSYPPPPASHPTVAVASFAPVRGIATAASLNGSVPAAAAAAAKRTLDDNDEEQNGEDEQQPVKKKKRAYNHESFPCKLHRLLGECQEQGKDHIVRWLDNGRQFEILDTSAFETEVLPNYFRHGHISSFKRLLRMYEFRRTRGTWEEGIFEHDKFLRNNPDLCKEIERAGLKFGSQY